MTLLINIAFQGTPGFEANFSSFFLDCVINLFFFFFFEINVKYFDNLICIPKKLVYLFISWTAIVVLVLYLMQA